MYLFVLFLDAIWGQELYILKQNKKETSDFHGTVYFDPFKMLQQK